jgi:hypothetical protein
MPEPSVAGQVPQTEVADTPASQDKPRTQTGQESLMDFLDIPADVQGQLKPREATPELPGDVPAPPQQAAPPPPTEEEVQPSRDEEAAEEPDEEAEETPPEPAQGETPKLDKRQKRINRLTRQKSELQNKLDATYAEQEELRRKLTQYESVQQQTAAGAVPTFNRLGWITSEQQLATEAAKADAMIEWCDANAEGVTTGSGENEKYYDADTVAYWRREAQKVVMAAPMRREELRQYGDAKNHFDGLVRNAWPDLLDQSSEGYQIAQAVYRQYPQLAGLPQGLYVVGLLIEGAKSVDARAAQNGQVPQRAHRDIDERAFAPRVPLSPHIANPPTRPVTPSSKQRINEAMDNLVKDTDGSATSVAAAFAAMDAARPQQRPTGKTPVRS